MLDRHRGVPLAATPPCQRLAPTDRMLADVGGYRRVTITRLTLIAVRYFGSTMFLITLSSTGTLRLKMNGPSTL